MGKKVPMVFSSKLEGKYEGNKMDLGYIWFLENLRENLRETKYKGKVERKKKSSKIKNKLKVDKLFFFCYFKLILFILTHQYKD